MENQPTTKSDFNLKEAILKNKFALSVAGIIILYIADVRYGNKD